MDEEEAEEEAEEEDVAEDAAAEYEVDEIVQEVLHSDPEGSEDGIEYIEEGQQLPEQETHEVAEAAQLPGGAIQETWEANPEEACELVEIIEEGELEEEGECVEEMEAVRAEELLDHDPGGAVEEPVEDIAVDKLVEPQGEGSDDLLGLEEDAISDISGPAEGARAPDEQSDEDDDVEIISANIAGQTSREALSEDDIEEAPPEDDEHDAPPEDDADDEPSAESSSSSDEEPDWLRELTSPQTMGDEESAAAANIAEVTAAFLDGLTVGSQAYPQYVPSLSKYLISHPEAVVSRKGKKGKGQKKGGGKRYFGGEERSEDVMANKVVSGCWACGKLDHESQDCIFKRCFVCSGQGHEVNEPWPNAAG